MSSVWPSLIWSFLYSSGLFKFQQKRQFKIQIKVKKMKHFTQSMERDDVTTSNPFLFWNREVFLWLFFCVLQRFLMNWHFYFLKKKQCWRALNLFPTKNPESLTLWLAVRDLLLAPSLRQRFPDIWENIWWGGEHFINCRENKHSTEQGSEHWAPGWKQGIQGMRMSIIFHGTAGDQWDKDS